MIIRYFEGIQNILVIVIKNINFMESKLILFSLSFFGNIVEITTIKFLMKDYQGILYCFFYWLCSSSPTSQFQISWQGRWGQLSCISNLVKSSTAFSCDRALSTVSDRRLTTPHAEGLIAATARLP